MIARPRARDSTPPPGVRALRLLVWNIHKGIGGKDRRYRLERIEEVLRHHDPDVALLQEVARGMPRAGGDDQPRRLAEALGFEHSVFAPTVRLTRGCHGNATLSRFPIRRDLVLDVTFPMKKRRSIVLTEVTGERRRRVVLLNMHLGLSGIERRWQIARLLRAEPLTTLGPKHRLVLGGDTNDWSGALWRTQIRAAGFECATGTGRRATRTFPSRRPVGALDRVFVRGAVVPRRHERSRLALAREASDHLPVVVHLDLKRMG